MHIAKERTSDGYRQLVMENKQCSSCNGTGQADRWKPCPNYGKPVYGKPCPTPGCGTRRKTDHRYIPDGSQPCQRCDTSGIVGETEYDYVPHEVWTALNFRVLTPSYEAARGLTWTESYIGSGVYSAVDYGAHWKLSDAALIEQVRDARPSSHQAVKFTKPMLSADAPNERADRFRLCDAIVIIRRKDGYLVQAAFFPTSYIASPAASASPDAQVAPDTNDSDTLATR